MEPLLIMSCSMRKRPGAHRARDLYDGSAYRVLRLRAPHNLPLLILSAEHGLISSDEVIEFYDRKMDASRAQELSGGGRIRDARRLVGQLGSFDHVFCYGGILYRQVIEAYAEAGVFNAAKVEYSFGRIGEQLAQLKNFLTQGTPSSMPPVARIGFWRGRK